MPKNDIFIRIQNAARGYKTHFKDCKPLLQLMESKREQRVIQSPTPKSSEEIKALVIKAGTRRVRPCLMTTATTILALIPVLTSTGRGSDIMVPMAIPSFGGMAVEVITMLVVPVLYCLIQEVRLKYKQCWTSGAI